MIGFLLIAVGVLFWVGFHLIPMKPRWASYVQSVLGEDSHKKRGIVALGVAIGLGFIITGSQFSPYVEVWTPPFWLGHWALILVPISIILMVASYLKSVLRRKIRHPQLLAIKLWTLAHLLANGDLASIILFGGLFMWAILSIVLINKRDGAWSPPENLSWKNDILSIVIGLAVSAGIIALHPWLFGVPVFIPAH